MIKESAPIGLVIKIIMGISIVLIVVILTSFAIAFEESRDFLVPILVEVIGGIIVIVSFPFLWRFLWAIITSCFLRGETDKSNKVVDVLPKKKAIKKSRNVLIRKSVALGKGRRKGQ